MNNNLRKAVRVDAGFTLIEALMAMTLLAIASAGVLLPFANAASVQDEAARRTAAAGLASGMMERIRATDYDSVMTTYNGYTEPVGGLKDSAGQPITGPAYRDISRAVVCQTATVANVQMLWVTVHIFYKGGEIVKVGTLIGKDYRN